MCSMLRSYDFQMELQWPCPCGFGALLGASIKLQCGFNASISTDTCFSPIKRKWVAPVANVILSQSYFVSSQPQFTRFNKSFGKTRLVLSHCGRFRITLALRKLRNKSLRNIWRKPRGPKVRMKARVDMTQTSAKTCMFGTVYPSRVNWVGLCPKSLPGSQLVLDTRQKQRVNINFRSCLFVCCEVKCALDGLLSAQ